MENGRGRVIEAVSKADFIFAGHSHATISVMYRSSLNASSNGYRIEDNDEHRAYRGVDFTARHYQRGEKLDSNDFSVQVIENEPFDQSRFG